MPVENNEIVIHRLKSCLQNEYRLIYDESRIDGISGFS